MNQVIYGSGTLRRSWLGVRLDEPIGASCPLGPLAVLNYQSSRSPMACQVNGGNRRPQMTIFVLLWPPGNPTDCAS